MNVKLLAAIALLVQSGVLLVSVDYKLPYGLQTVNNLVFFCRYTGWYYQPSNVKPMLGCNAPATSL
jgi:hypothetical protein